MINKITANYGYSSVLSKKAVTAFLSFELEAHSVRLIVYQPYTLVQSKEGVSELPADILALLKQS